MNGLFAIRRMHVWGGLLCCASAPAAVVAQTMVPAEVAYPSVVVRDTALEFRQFDKVEITGSSILRKAQTQTLPVQVVTRADIQRSGKQSIADYLQNLPVMFNGFSPATMGAVKSGFSGASVHGLQTGTLVLVNGRRLANYGRQASSGLDNGGVDLNALPLSAIDRIEILTDGASSVYGTDAQTGVVNIITRTDRPGFEITADHRMPDEQKGLGSRVDLSFGQGVLAKDGYSWYVAADVSRQQELLGRDRPYAAAGRYLVQQNGQDHWAYGTALTAAQTSPTLASSRTAPYAGLWNADFQNGQCPNGNVPAWGKTACLDNNYLDKGLYPEVDAARLHAQGQWRMGADITAFAELSWQQMEQRRAYNAWGQYAAQIGQTPDSPGYDLALAQGFDPAQGAWLLYSGSQLGPTNRRFDLVTRRLVTGLKGQWRDWNFQTSAYFSANTGALWFEGFRPYPNLGLDPQGRLTNPALLSPLSSNTEAASVLRNQLSGMVMPMTLSNRGTNRLQGVDLKASRAVGEIDGQDVLLAFGTDWRQEKADLERFTGAVPSYNGQRTVWAQFAELQVPLPHQAELLASLRNDRYSDFGNTTHGKVSAKWVPHDQWLLRGAWGTGFRAPAVAQMQETEKVLTSALDYGCSAELRSAAAALGTQCAVNNRYFVYSQGSAQLKPELSTQWNLGARFSPSRNNTWSLDYWRVDVRDVINTFSANVVMAHPLRYINSLERNANGQLQLFTPMINVGKTQTSGVDFSWAFRRPTDWGQLHLGLSGTWLLTSKYQLADGEPFVSDLNSYSSYTSWVMPKLKTRWHAGLHQANWQWLATISHVGSHDDGGSRGSGINPIEVSTGQAVTFERHRVPAWWTLDLMVAHQWGPKTSLRLGIENALNRRAPLDFGFTTSFNYGTNPMLANVWGRTVNLSMTHRF
ncbi:TonB-dependent receptor [Limnohabitans sp.]|uniref:TonB-dependent receptor domain-containing protein n=1 Tax=Limnohabitans sp. TaxID=1907725 RepID=UPI0025BFB5B7|nr:TonB-dependent receptor [Limnohabitans sp.]